MDDIKKIEEELNDKIDRLEDVDFSAVSDDNIVSSTIGTYLGQIGKYDLYTREEEIDAFTRLKNGDENAQNDIIVHNLRLVVSIARKYAKVSKSLTIEDLIMEGNIGLITAIKKFDLEKGFKFSTYASWWIKQSILRAIMNNDSNIRIPVHLHEKLLAANNEIKKTEDEIGRHLTGDEIEEIYKKHSSSEVNYLQLLGSQNVLSMASLDAPIIREDSDEDTTILDLMASQDEVPIENIISKRVDGKKFWDYIESKLNPRELDVIRRRFGYYGKCETLEMIGNDYHVTRERIRQIESKALRKLRLPHNMKYLRNFRDK